jgi:uncharacterized protein (DUF697 family)
MSMGLPVKAGVDKARGLQKTFKMVRDEANRRISIAVCSDPEVEIKVLKMLEPDSDNTKDGQRGDKPENKVFAAGSIADREQRSEALRNADLAIIVITPEMPNEQVARVAMSASLAPKRLVILVDREHDIQVADRLAKILGAKTENIAFLPRMDSSGFVNALTSKILDIMPDEKIALAASLDPFKDETARRIIAKAASQNALIGLLVFMPGADMPLLTMNQIRMVLQLSALYRQEISLKRAYEILGVVAGGYVFRELARELVAFVPVLGWLAKGAIAYTGTMAIGRLAIKFLELKSGNELEAKR